MLSSLSKGGIRNYIRYFNKIRNNLMVEQKPINNVIVNYKKNISSSGCNNLGKTKHEEEKTFERKNLI